MRLYIGVTTQRFLSAMGMAAALAFSSACGGNHYHLAASQTNQTVYTLTNLHPDPVRRRLYSVNFQQRGLIPLCTPVVIHRVSGDTMRFSVASTGVEYEYVFHHRTLTEPIATHLDRYFGPTCDPQLVNDLGDADRAGIRDGEVYAGMTKTGVILAVGYPPMHQTRLQDDVWQYWLRRNNARQVFFVDGVVEYVRD